MLCVVEGGFKAANLSQINSGFQGENLQLFVLCCQSCRVRHGLISRGLVGWECGTGAFCSQGVSASRPVPGCPTTSSASSHLASTWGDLGQSVPRCSSEYEPAFALPSGIAPQAGQLTVAVPGYMAWVGLLVGSVTWAYLPPDGGQGGHVSCRCCVKKCQGIQGSHWAIHGMKYFEMYLDTIWLASWTSSRILMASWRSLQWSRPLKTSSSAPDLTGRAQSNFSLLTFCLVPGWQLLSWAVLLPFEASWCCRGTSCVSKAGTTPVSVLMYCRLNAFSKELKLSNFPSHFPPFPLVCGECGYPWQSKHHFSALSSTGKSYTHEIKSNLCCLGWTVTMVNSARRPSWAVWRCLRVVITRIGELGCSASLQFVNVFI